MTMMPQQSSNPLLTDDYLCIVLTDIDMKVRIIKYEISLPRLSS